jgi:CBS domain-containing protein
VNAAPGTMSTTPVTLEPTTSIGRLLALFDRYDFDAFPVVGQQSRLVGIVSKLDVLELFLGRRRSTLGATDMGSTTQIADAMRRKAVFIEPLDGITAAGKLMVVTNLRSLPVMKRRESRIVLVRMLSRGMLRWLRSQLVDRGYVRKEKAS